MFHVDASLCLTVGSRKPDWFSHDKVMAAREAASAGESVDSRACAAGSLLQRCGLYGHIAGTRGLRPLHDQLAARARGAIRDGVRHLVLTARGRERRIDEVRRAAIRKMRDELAA